MATKSIFEWLKECLYIQRNAAWQGWAGASRFLDIKAGIRQATGMSEDGFNNWLERLKRAGY